jgi:hypothetical protein
MPTTKTCIYGPPRQLFSQHRIFGSTTSSAKNLTSNQATTTSGLDTTEVRWADSSALMMEKIRTL